LAAVAAVTANVPVKLGLPVRHIGSWDMPINAAPMLMPEAPMDQHDRIVAPQNYIGLAR